MTILLKTYWLLIAVVGGLMLYFLTWPYSLATFVILIAASSIALVMDRRCSVSTARTIGGIATTIAEAMSEWEIWTNTVALRMAELDYQRAMRIMAELRPQVPATVFGPDGALRIHPGTTEDIDTYRAPRTLAEADRRVMVE